MEHSEMTEKQSLALITSMIKEAKGDIGANSIFYLLWGWVTLAACVSQYSLMEIDFAHHYIAWVVLMPLAGIVSAIIGNKQKKQEHIGPIAQAMKYLWTATTFTIIIVMANGFQMQWKSAYMVLLALVGLATFVSGSMLKFTPLKIGGYFAWAMAGAALYVPLQYTVALIGLTMIVSYLVPGYLLKRAYAQKA